MNATNKLLDKWIAWRSTLPGKASSNAAIAKDLGVGAPSIANYRAELSQAAPHVIEKMARDLGENPALWLALVESERARNASDRRTWAAVFKQLSTAAALVVAVALPFTSSAAPAQAERAEGVGIMRSGRRWAKFALRHLHSLMTMPRHGTPALLA